MFFFYVHCQNLGILLGPGTRPNMAKLQTASEVQMSQILSGGDAIPVQPFDHLFGDIVVALS